MKSHTTRKFREAVASLSPEIRQAARLAYRRFRHDPQPPGLSFKRDHATDPIYSVRITRDYRAVGVLDEDQIIWFWIGPHDAYERLLKSL